MLALPGQSGSFGFGSRHGPSEGALDRLGAPLPRPVGGIDRGNKTALNPAPRRAIQACLPGASGGIVLQWTAVNAIPRWTADWSRPWLSMGDRRVDEPRQWDDWPHQGWSG